MYMARCTFREGDKEETALGVGLSAIRRVSGFRLVSDEAVLVLAKTIPIDILADEMRGLYFRPLEYPG